MSNYIYSTLPTDYAFAIYEQQPDGTAKPVVHVFVRGGAQMAIQAGAGFDTPLGIVTQVTDDELALLQKDFTFNHFVTNGFMIVDSKKVDVEKVAGNMNTNAPSTPASEQDILDIGSPDGVEIKVFEDRPVKKARK